jgi:sialate O-acetylesterase
MKRLIPLLWATGLLVLPGSIQAELKLPALVSDHMVLQQKQANPIWGWDNPGTTVKVSFAGQTKSAVAGADGRWEVKLDAMAASSNPQILSIEAAGKKRDLQDVLVGEVWMCSGQSNMEWTVSKDWNAEPELAAANYPNMRLIRVPKKGTQDLQQDFAGAWSAVTPESTKGFSAVGYFFGRTIHQAVGVPVGLIDNSWGGSAAEAWVRRDTMEKEPKFASLVQRTVEMEKYKQSAKAQEDFKAEQEKHKVALEKAKAAGKPAPRAPQSPEAWLTGNARIGNIFAGVVHPTIGYGIKGVIWYQGESNSARAWEYASLFPFMIEQWRKEWKQGNFPFYWVQLADYMAEDKQPVDSTWAELRESQTKTLSLPNTGQAVIVDLGEARDIHPRNKHDVAARLVRWALVKDYGFSMNYRSPEFKSLQIEGEKAIVTVDCFGSSLRTFDVDEVRGFAICGEDRKWVWASGKIVGQDRIEVSSEAVSKPVAVRYGWGNNPVCNVMSVDGGLPLTPFRTDDFPMMTQPKEGAK